MAYKFKVYKDKRGEFRFRFEAPNGEIMFSGQGYKQKKVHQLRSRVSKKKSNQLSVMMELQADCLAGVWAYHANRSRRILEEGDVEEGLNAASAIGDDRLQRKARGHITPDSFTHGSSAQRVRWFRQGIELGNVNQCNSFSADRL